MRKPVIGITCVATQMQGANIWANRDTYFKVVLNSGGLPIMLPLMENLIEIRAFANLIDGLILTGGGDINPKLYGSKKHKLTGKLKMTISDKRDWTEINLLKQMKNKPVLGICRGSQIINVVHGGDLIQHIETKKERHLYLEKGYKGINLNKHKIIIQKETLLEKIALEQNKKLLTRVNSGHHQAIGKLGKNLKVIAKSPEGIIEGVESTKHNFRIGVQWHPEKMPRHWITKALIKRFIQETQKN